MARIVSESDSKEEDEIISAMARCYEPTDATK